MAHRIIWLRQVSVVTNTSPAMPQLTYQTITDMSAGHGAGVCVDNDRNIFVVDSTNNVVYKYQFGGSQLPFVFAGTFGSAGSTDGKQGVGKLSSPSAVCVDSRGTLYVLDASGTAVRRVDETGVMYTVCKGLSTAAVSIAVDKAGEIYLVEA